MAASLDVARIGAGGIEPDQKKGACGYFDAEKVKEIGAALKG